MTDEAFKLYIQEAVEKLGVPAIARAFSISHPSVRRWAEGVSRPHEVMMPQVIKTIDSLLEAQWQKK